MSDNGLYKGQEHAIYRGLIASGLSDAKSWEKFADRTRDREDVAAWRCKKSGVIILGSTDHIADSHYTGQPAFAYWNAADRKAALVSTQSDDHRRAQFLRDKIRGKTYLDVGTGLGGVLDLLRNDASKIECVELQPEIAKTLEIAGYRVFRDIANVPDKTYQVISSFHVLEHIQEPDIFLKTLRQKLTDDGQVFIEVPHANDALLSRYKSDAFKEFTLWSEHLILHTKESLEATFRNAGFKVLNTVGVQRYSLANHLHWLSKQKPNGQNIWKDLDNKELNSQYEQMLLKLGETDSLLLIAAKE
jgi:cyclopropane fatty-acyl-phospholipid synthase-like methyltransferase